MECSLEICRFQESLWWIEIWFLKDDPPQKGFQLKELLLMTRKFEVYRLAQN